MARKNCDSMGIKCPICSKGKLLIAANTANIDRLEFCSTKDENKAEWFLKCPRCRNQVGFRIKELAALAPAIGKI